MNTIAKWVKIGVLPCLSTFSVMSAVAGNVDKKPNVVIIMADDLGYGDLSCYGATHIQTPGIDALANSSLRFTNAYATSATSTPSRYAMLTGMYPWRVGAAILPGDAPLLIKETQPTLPKMMKAAGYETGVVGKWHLGLGNGNLNWNEHISPSPNEIGFDYSYIMAATNDRVPSVYVQNGRVVNWDPNDPIEVSYRQNFPGEPTGKNNPELLKMHPSVGHSASIINGVPRIGFMKGGNAARWIDEEMAEVFLGEAKNYVKKHQDQPFFLYYALHEPHVPRLPNEKFAGKSQLGPRGDVILEADWCVGEFLKYLDELGLSDNTIVIFTSDNGPVLDDGYKDMAEEMNGDHTPAGPFKGWKTDPYEGGTRIPMIVRWPQKIKPGQSDAMICQMDFYASFAKLLGQPNTTPDSKDMLKPLLGKTTKGRKSLVLEGYINSMWIKAGDWACIPPYKYGKNMTEPELYYLKEDAGQKTNVAQKYPDKVNKMTAEMKAVMNKK